jgi:protocatechuate 3,4-dioxygenase beta subunit
MVGRMRGVPIITRRGLIGAGLALTLAPLPRALAASLPTPRQTAGPFYPRGWTGEADADLLSVAGQAGPPAGQVLQLAGRVFGADGLPRPGVAVEIWQADSGGRYHYPQPGATSADPAFQGYGRATTGADGGYAFRTLKPGEYTGRTPHIHFRLSGGGITPLITQMYFAGEPGNARDHLFGDLAETEQRRLLVALMPEAGALAGRFDIVLA